MQIRKSLLALAISASLGSQFATGADTSGGSLKGQVTGAAGEVIASATITVTHIGKGLVRTVQSNAKGEYNLRNLPVGEYRIRFEKDGYSPAQAQDVRVRVGQSMIYDGTLTGAGQVLEEVQVTGSMLRRIDTGSSTAGVVITQERLQALPVNTGFEAMAQLAPGVAQPGGSSFNGASSFGGASSAENGYYLNGLNVSNIKTGLGSIALPWEAISQTQVKTGAIDPEYGGALGGIINAVSKSGDNEFKFGSQVRFDPNSMHEQHNSVRRQSGDYEINTEQSGESFTESQFWASGPIVPDKAFFYALFAPRTTKDEWVSDSSYYDRVREEDRWLVRLDWFINENHSLDITAINNEENGERDNYAYDPSADKVGDFTGVTATREGGNVYGLHYSGQLTDALAIDLVAGRTQETIYNAAISDLPIVEDCRNACLSYSNHSDSTVGEEDYTRDQLRLDISYELLNHSLKAGVDYNKVDLYYDSTPNGIGGALGWWSQDIAEADDGSNLEPGTSMISRRVRTRHAESDVSARAIYLQDSWAVTDQLTLNLGARYEQFENTATDGCAQLQGAAKELCEQDSAGDDRVFVDADGFSPRLQAVYDLHGDGDTKVYATYGRYYQPVSTNMNITQGSASREYFEYYALDQVDANGRATLLSDGSPSRGEQLSGYVRQEGIVDADLIASANLEGMYSDEFTVGFETLVFDDMVLGVRGIYRDLKRSIEDTDVGPVLGNRLAEMGIDNKTGQSSFYVLMNPGEDMEISYDFDGDGQVDNVKLSAAELALPEPKRRYFALETSLRGQVTDRLYMDASYTWSHSYGNTEGLVRTDNDQADPGWTTSYDYADLMDHGSGDLPNDHRHAVKMNGFYDFSDNLTLGLVTSLVSGRPQNYFSIHPAGVDSCAEGSPWSDCISRYYGAASFYDENGNPAKRGSKGNLPWAKQVDLSLTYTRPLFDGELMLKGTVYNLLNDDAALDVMETRTINGELNPDYGIPQSRVEARYLSLVARYNF
ncbi:TonB-dependent receptor [Microbulbifer taiwanensis]|uniref:TonB-dependent receptor domain-containing protein n=1 Tax=Microbulbifer taiwanensis TaxID=986746 RepID=A0ABW1YUR1_9GAMM|nr:TonB-dependent receptor [Microbulbifer taiwanensis]